LRLEAVLSGVLREFRVVFLTSKPLLLSGGYDLSIGDEARGAVVVER
jgi:hypothetical protein